MRDLTAVKNALKQHQIELPSWAFGNSGTRFKVFGQPGVPRTPYEKASDAAQVHTYTGVAPSMAVHIPWDTTDDYADDDLMVGAADPFQLFRITHEVVKASALAPAAGVAFMLDQCHNIEPKIPAQIRSVMNVQEAVAKALLIDRAALAAAQQAGDVLGANAVLMDAYNTDVRPLLAGLRAEMGLDPDPVTAYLRSGYGEKIIAGRVGGTPASWGS